MLAAQCELLVRGGRGDDARAERQPGDAARNAAALNELWSAGRIRPVVSATYPLEDAAAALKDIAARKVTGKVVLTTERGRAAVAGAPA